MEDLWSLFGGPGSPYRHPGNLEESFTEFFRHAEPVHIEQVVRGRPTLFTFKYLDRFFDVAFIEPPTKRTTLAIRLESPFPMDVLLKTNRHIALLLEDYFGVPAPDRVPATDDLAKLQNDPCVMRQLKNMDDFQLIALSRTDAVAARYLMLEEFSGHMLLHWATSLHYLNYYGAACLKRLSMKQTGQETSCPYCKDVVTGGMKCRRCGTTHHEACWKENGGCAVYGCRISLLRGKP